MGSPDAPPNAKTVKTFPNLKPVPISAIALALSWDYFSQAGDIENDIDNLKKIPGVNTEDLESRKTKKTIFGVLCCGTRKWSNRL